MVTSISVKPDEERERRDTERRAKIVRNHIVPNRLYFPTSGVADVAKTVCRLLTLRDAGGRLIATLNDVYFVKDQTYEFWRKEAAMQVIFVDGFF